MSKYNINFKTIKFKNFMAYGNSFTEFNFNNGLTLITGPNGNGKSAIMIALFYGLYGKSFKKNKLGSLINDINNKDMRVEITFDAGDNSYKIIRGQKPSIFEIYENDKLLDQRSSTSEYQDYLETYILKINENIFRQLIFLGANVVGSKSFIDLTKSEKEDLFQIITDTSIFKIIKDNIKERSNKLKTEQTETNYKINVLNSAIESERINLFKMEEQNKLVEKNSNGRLDDIDIKIASLELNNETYKEYINKVKDKKDIYNTKCDEYKVAVDNNTKLNSEYQQLQLEISKITTAKNAFATCIGCEKLVNISKVDLSKEEQYINELSVVKDNLEKNNQIKAELDLFITNFKRSIEKARLYNDNILLNNKEIDSLNSEKDNINSQSKIDIDYSTFNKNKEDLDELKKNYTKISNELSNLKTLDGLLSNDNLKGVIINQTLPILNKYINEYIQKFSDFEFNFYIDSNFKENIIFKSRDREYYSLSNGQGFRIMFSILFAFLKMVEERNGISCNILALDEYLDGSLDKTGRHEVLGILKEEFCDKNVIIISHNDDITNTTEYFDKSYRVNLVNSFSKIDELI